MSAALVWLCLFNVIGQQAQARYFKEDHRLVVYESGAEGSSDVDIRVDSDVEDLIAALATDWGLDCTRPSVTAEYWS